MDTETLIPFMETLLDQSGAVIEPYFFNRDYSVEVKADESPVTQVDREAETCIRTLIRREFPHHGIVGEEFGTENEGAEYTWVIDPIDGTKAFITGVPLFTTLIGLLHRGEPVLGAIHQPLLKIRCIGDNRTCLLNGKPTRCRSIAKLEEATMVSSGVLTAEQYQNGARFDALIRRVNLYRTWADGYGYLLLASGKADIAVDPIVHPWDVFPVIPVVRGAGARVSDWQGNTDRWESCVAANPGLFDQVIDALNGD
ncbi:MAG: histidinol-phosphatase [Opitutae bacterium]|nr:histidinol-phosphatase [Opitutae bacterium]